MRNREKIIQEIEEIKERLNDFTLDFISDYELVGIEYIEDKMSEYADSHVNIYYGDIYAYYDDHKKESSDALKEFGYTLADFDDLDEAIEKGSQLAQYLELYNELMQDFDDVEQLKELYEELEEEEE